MSGNVVQRVVAVFGAPGRPVVSRRFPNRWIANQAIAQSQEAVARREAVEHLSRARQQVQQAARELKASQRAAQALDLRALNSRVAQGTQALRVASQLDVASKLAGQQAQKMRALQSTLKGQSMSPATTTGAFGGHSGQARSFGTIPAALENPLLETNPMEKVVLRLRGRLNASETCETVEEKMRCRVQGRLGASSEEKTVFKIRGLLENAETAAADSEKAVVRMRGVLGKKEAQEKPVLRIRGVLEGKKEKTVVQMRGVLGA